MDQESETKHINPGPGGDASQCDTEGDKQEQDMVKHTLADTVTQGDVPQMDDQNDKPKIEDVAMVTGSESQDASQAQESKAAIHPLLDCDLAHLLRPERSMLYEKGVKFLESGHGDRALKCWLGAITGLDEKTSFPELPKCLHGIADVYFDKKEYEKAVYFIQAEKMYYETALIDIAGVIHKQPDSDINGSEVTRDGNQDGGDKEPGEESKEDEVTEDKGYDLPPDAKKGQEFENLARLCLKEGKLQLALEYCGKATKMYQSVYGEEHPVTVAALDLFTVIYADVGKKLYSDAMQKFEEEEKTLEAEKSADQSHDNTPPDTELRNRLHNNNKESVAHPAQDAPDTTHLGELEVTSGEERDDWVMTILLMLIFFLITVFVAIAISSVYCYNNQKSGYCARTRGDINYWYMYIRHVIHDFRKNF